MNYLVINKPSQLILTTVTTSHTPTPDGKHTFISTSKVVLDKYYKLAMKARRSGVLVTVGDLAAASPNFLESLQR